MTDNWKDISSAPTGPLLLWLPKSRLVVFGRRQCSTPSAKGYHNFSALLTSGWVTLPNEQPTYWQPEPEPPKELG